MALFITLASIYLLLMILKGVESVFSIVRSNPIQLAVSMYHLALLDDIQTSLDDHNEKMKKDHEAFHG